jgi:hypothetical protein
MRVLLPRIAARKTSQKEQARSSHRLVAACAKVSPDRAEPDRTVREARSTDDLVAQALQPA